MVLGVDFGTTRIVAAAADRGNYPLISFEGPDGQTRDWFPPLAAIRNSERLYGWDTWPVLAHPEWTVVRSLKRTLKDGGPNTELDLGGQHVPLRTLLVELLSAFRNELLTRSTLHASPDEPLHVMLGVPANANSNQRFLTADAFRTAGFQVLGVLNEPSAASVEYAHRDREIRKPQSRGDLMVYDLGGGTFDASLVETGADAHTVIATAGIADLGGDDFDEVLAEIALEACGRVDGSLTLAQLFRLLEECREKKEALNSNTRRIVIDLERVSPGWGEISIPAGDFYERCRPLIEQTRQVAEDLLAAHSERGIDTLYVTGGGSELPPVARILKETFGRRVRRSSYMRSATAIGLAISGDPDAGFRVKDRLTQNFGVWRESDAGRNVSFDLLVPGGIPLPSPGETPIRILRQYQPAHNVGHFRYVECSRVSPDGQPSGDITPWDDVRFPFDPDLVGCGELEDVPVLRQAPASPQWVEEEYSCDAGGNLCVRISNRSAGYQREYRLGNWAGNESRVKPQRRRRATRGAR